MTTQDALEAVLRALALPTDPADALPDAVRATAAHAGGGRGALLLVTADGKSGFLVATADEPNLMRVPVAMARHGQVADAVAARTPVVCEDAAAEALLSDTLDGEAGPRKRLAVWPLPRGPALGALLVEWPQPGPPSPETHAFCVAAAASIGAALAGSRLLEELRERTNPRHAAQDGGARARDAIATYSDFFDAASDGMIVVDAEARVLHVNRAAEHILGWARDGLVGRSLLDIVAEPYRDSLREVARSAAAGTVYSAFDLDLLTTSGDPVVASVATSAVLSELGAAVLSFRDVTLERALENELRKTKEFLERLIDSTIDAIIAADIDGTVILFNSGAERIYGWRADQAVGRMSVERLYPAGVAREVMRMLRSDEHGGKGRLEATRQLIVTAAGKVVPVMLSAAIVYEEGREIATVGVFSDLRERLTMEANLVEVREKLEISEKQALVAELAGTTAHELNQPLTSIMGYAELMKRRLPADDPNARSLDIILREAERMAEIVRKIGKITRYETKAYVGDTRILDLEKSTE